MAILERLRRGWREKSERENTSKWIYVEGDTKTVTNLMMMLIIQEKRESMLGYIWLYVTLKNIVCMFCGLVLVVCLMGCQQGTEWEKELTIFHAAFSQLLHPLKPQHKII